MLAIGGTLFTATPAGIERGEILNVGVGQGAHKRLHGCVRPSAIPERGDLLHKISLVLARKIGPERVDADAFRAMAALADSRFRGTLFYITGCPGSVASQETESDQNAG